MGLSDAEQQWKSQQSSWPRENPLSPGHIGQKPQNLERATIPVAWLWKAAGRTGAGMLCASALPAWIQLVLLRDGACGRAKAREGC